ncbi:universal stress protein [Candidatus Kapabacteria bacterium]|nr:universal stress protein [Candidatus Kapabacteria bacterium]
MYVYKNILLPTDFSEGSEKAFLHAVDIAKSMNAKIHVLHIIQQMVYPAGFEIAQNSFSNIEEALEKNANSHLSETSKRLSNLGIDNETHILMGKPSEQIIEFSNQEFVDLVVIPTNGAGGLEHFLFGSTTEKVIRGVSCPVLVTHIDSNQ